MSSGNVGETVLSFDSYRLNARRTDFLRLDPHVSTVFASPFSEKRLWFEVRAVLKHDQTPSFGAHFRDIFDPIQVHV